MTFTQADKLKALAIVNIFETSKALGDYSAVAVLNDGAGISYGFLQFTHRSGALVDVVERYIAAGGVVAKEVLVAGLPLLRSGSAASRERLAADGQFKKALRAAAVTREMKAAQHAVAEERYLAPAIRFCERMSFTLPLSLAVVYDSIVHGSFDRVAAKAGTRGSLAGTPASLPAREKAWITEYVRRRHIWLTAIVRLKATNYRTRFFLNQIAVGNWQLKLPLNVHGVPLSDLPADAGTPASLPAVDSGGDAGSLSIVPSSAATRAGRDAGVPATAGTEPQVPAPDILASAAANFDRVDGVVSAVIARTDRAKSLWATIVGSLSQAVWAVFGFFAGLPREVWIVVAVIAGALTLLFLYRQVSLGKIRESSTGY